MFGHSFLKSPSAIMPKSKIILLTSFCPPTSHSQKSQIPSHVRVVLGTVCCMTQDITGSILVKRNNSPKRALESNECTGGFQHGKAMLGAFLAEPLRCSYVTPAPTPNLKAVRYTRITRGPGCLCPKQILQNSLRFFPRQCLGDTTLCAVYQFVSSVLCSYLKPYSTGQPSFPPFLLLSRG